VEKRKTDTQKNPPAAFPIPYPLNPPTSPTNNLSEPEHANPKTFVEICTSVAKKSFPFTSSFPSINKKPHQQRSDPEHPNPKNVENLKIAIKKFHLLPSCPPVLCPLNPEPFHPPPKDPRPKTQDLTPSQSGKYSHHKKPVFPKNSPIDSMPPTEKPNTSRVLVQGSNPTTSETTEKFHLLPLTTDH
jgi:hypothetical protein